MLSSNIIFRPWTKPYPPKKVLAIRFQALGDTIITLPYLQSLKRRYPSVQLHFLTREEVSPVPKSIDLFDKVIVIRGGRSLKLQTIQLFFKLPYLWWQRYDIVLDLQNHKLSTLLRRLLMIKAWTEFDKYSENAAGERTQRTIEALGLWKIGIDTDFKIKSDVAGLLTQHGWKDDQSLVVLNPAGSFPSRNWPVENYIEFARQWLTIHPHTQFVLLLLPSLMEKAKQIQHALGDKVINLTGKANQVEAFAVLKKCKFVLSEDGGLMHMAWVQGVPTLALFSSSRKDWSAPQGEWSYCFDSSDLECGPCMREVCIYGDNRCLTRYSPELVLKKSKELLTVI